MLVQSLSVALLVAGCAVYAAWTLMPAASRRRIAAALLKTPLPESLAGFMRRHATAASGCGCDGCDRASPEAATPATTQPITFHRAPPRR